MPSDLSFHCIICFETFDSSDTYPVVLPCGHTYVCYPCAIRLEKCMECRASLFLPEEAKIANRPVNSNGRQRGQPSWYSGRAPSSVSGSSRSAATRASGYRNNVSNAEPFHDGPSHPGDRPHKTLLRERKRFPLPKNLVLLSLMEVVDTNIESERKAARNLVNMERQGDEEEDIDIEIASNRLSSACGTYAVIASEGISIFVKSYNSSNKVLKRTNTPASPSSGKHRSGFYKKVLSKTKNKDVLIEQQVRNILDEMDLNTECCCPESHGAAETLAFRDKVQVVCIVDGWARLARGRGFVAVDQLVKVGPPLDRSCRTEGLLFCLSQKHSDLKKEEIETKRLLLALKEDLHKSLLCEDLTIVRAPPEILIDEETHIPQVECPEDPCASSVDTATPSTNEVPVIIKIENSPTDSLKKKLQADTKIDFRTGMSGHHALGNYKNTNSLDRVKRVSKMSAHSGLNM